MESIITELPIGAHWQSPRAQVRFEHYEQFMRSSQVLIGERHYLCWVMALNKLFQFLHLLQLYLLMVNHKSLSTPLSSPLLYPP
jgi:hypothetical protein